MRNKKIKIKFKVTTSKRYSCGKCGKNINGIGGFIEIVIEENYYRNRVVSKVCVPCWDNVEKEMYADWKNKNKRYSELLKDRIVRKLK